MATHHAIVRSEHTGMRLDTFLANRFLHAMEGPPVMEQSTQGAEANVSGPVLDSAAPSIDLSRSAIQKLIARGQVTINGPMGRSMTPFFCTTRPHTKAAYSLVTLRSLN